LSHFASHVVLSIVARLGNVPPRSLYILAVASWQQWRDNASRYDGCDVLPAVFSASAPKHFLVW
jgi:hypothetical protein